MKATLYSFAVTSFLLVATACNASQISGTYVAHARGVVEMLQLTQMPDGEVNGVLNHADLNDGGKVSSKQASFIGSTAAGQMSSICSARSRKSTY